jgi:DNA-binding response OmpR family regulator
MNTARILLIDDEPSLLLTVGDQLRMEGYEVIAASSGDEALQALRLEPPDLIILDVSMPGMTGFSVLKKLSGPDGKPRYPILVFTTGVEGFLSKGGDPSQLLAEVKRILLKTQPAGKPEPASANRHHRVVMILEDEPLLNTRLKTSFNIAGYHAVMLSNGHGLAEALQLHNPAIILLKTVLAGTNGTSIAESLADYTSARGIPIILYDGSGIHRPEETFVNIDKFVPSNKPADLIKAVTTLLG